MAAQIGDIVTVTTNPSGDNDKKRTGKVFSFTDQGWPAIEVEPFHIACGPLLAIKYNGEIGCLIEGSWGIYGSARMAVIAEEYGYSDSEILDIAHRMLYSGILSEVTPEESEKLDEAADEIENWLNENVANEDHSFGWQDGEFFYQPTTWWQMEAN